LSASVASAGIGHNLTGLDSRSSSGMVYPTRCSPRLGPNSPAPKATSSRRNCARASVGSSWRPSERDSEEEKSSDAVSAQRVVATDASDSHRLFAKSMSPIFTSKASKSSGCEGCPAVLEWISFLCLSRNWKQPQEPIEKCGNRFGK